MIYDTEGFMICNVWQDKNYKVMCSKNILFYQTILSK